MHPGLQKEYLKFLVNNKATTEFQIFISTHSNHVLDSINSSDKVSIFSVRKRRKITATKREDEEIPDFIVENLAHGDENILRLLGVTSTSVYLSNCVIWVEGITDKIYLQKYIECYLDSPNLKAKYTDARNYKEGIHYTFSLTGGDSIIHLDFDQDAEYEDAAAKIIISKFCSKSYVIVDNDSNKNRSRKDALAKTLLDRFVELNCPEIENLLPSEVILKTILTFKSVRSLIGSNLLKDIPEDLLAKQKIGYIIDMVVLKDYKDQKHFSGENGSIKSKDKYEFCIRSLKFLNSNNLKQSTVEVVEKILDFILSMNMFEKD